MRRHRHTPSFLAVPPSRVSDDGFSDVSAIAVSPPPDAADPVAIAAAAVSQKLEHDVVTVNDVRLWLDRVGFSAYVDVFTVNEIDGLVLKTLTSEELRDDLNITNLRHRRDIGHAIARLVEATSPVTVDALPEHGRILDHLSNIRTVFYPSSFLRLNFFFKNPQRFLTDLFFFFFLSGPLLAALGGADARLRCCYPQAFTKFSCNSHRHSGEHILLLRRCCLVHVRYFEVQGCHQDD